MLLNCNRYTVYANQVYAFTNRFTVFAIQVVPIPNSFFTSPLLVVGIPKKVIAISNRFNDLSCKVFDITDWEKAITDQNSSWFGSLIAFSFQVPVKN